MAPIPPDPIYTFRKEMAQINCLLICNDNNNELLYVGTIRGIVHIWDLKTKREMKTIKVCDGECLAIVRFNNNFLIQERGECFSYWKEDEKIEWHLLRTVKYDYNGFCKILTGCDEIFCPRNDGNIQIYKEDKKEILFCDYRKQVPRDKRGEVMCMKFLKSNNCLLVAYECGILSYWVFTDDNPKIEFEKKFEDTPMCLDFCELTGVGVLGTSGDCLKKFSIASDINECRSTTLTNPGVSSVMINSDGKLMAAGCWDGRIRYFSMKNLTLLAVLDHQTEGAVQCVMFLERMLTSCEVGSLFAAGSDGRVSLWDLYTKKAEKA